MNNELNGAAIAAAVAALLMAPSAFAAGGYGDDAKAKGSKMEAETIHCEGVNDCKSKGDCKSGDNCKGKNDCKGKGFLSMTKAECDAKKAAMTEEK